jgi:hypothetical protein
MIARSGSASDRLVSGSIAYPWPPPMMVFASCPPTVAAGSLNKKKAASGSATLILRGSTVAASHLNSVERAIE